MTVLEKKAARGVHVRGFTSYVAVGVLSVAVGVGVGVGIGEVADDEFGTQFVPERGAAVGEHLDSIWQTGLAQQQAMEDAALLESRIHTGLVQQQEIQSARGSRDAMEMRGAAMADHVETLTRTGGATQELSGG